jgi:hypothetical protein
MFDPMCPLGPHNGYRRRPPTPTNHWPHPQATGKRYLMPLLALAAIAVLLVFMELHMHRNTVARINSGAPTTQDPATGRHNTTPLGLATMR